MLHIAVKGQDRQKYLQDHKPRRADGKAPQVIDCTFMQSRSSVACPKNADNRVCEYKSSNSYKQCRDKPRCRTDTDNIICLLSVALSDSTGNGCVCTVAENIGYQEKEHIDRCDKTDRRQVCRAKLAEGAADKQRIDYRCYDIEGGKQYHSYKLAQKCTVKYVF